MPKKTKRPNILFLMTDQHRHDGLGCVNPVIKTPVLDNLAAGGVRFTQAVCNTPMCVASRYSMMSGLYSFQNGVKHNTQMIPRDADLPLPVLAQRLLEAGYQTAGIGKTHWYIGSRIMPDVEIEGSTRGFQTRAIVGGPEPRSCEPGSFYMAEDDPEHFAAINVESKRGGPGGESTPGYVGDTSIFPADQHREAWLTRQALEFLDGRDDAEGDDQNPFFLYLSFDAPHPGFFVPGEFEQLYDINDFDQNPLAETWPDTHAPGKLETRWPEMNSEERCRSRLRYAAYCSYVDSLFGQVLKQLEESDQLENTFVIFTSDHGEMLGDRGRVSKYCLYEGSVRVPLIVSGPGVKGGQGPDSRPAELVDVLPTLLDVAGLEIPEVLSGFSLLSDYARLGSFAEMHGRGYEEYQRAPAVMWRNEKWKLLLHIPGLLGSVNGAYDLSKGELYSLADDPREMNNLYDDPACAEVRGRMTTELLMHIMCCVGRFPCGPARTKIQVTGVETQADNSFWDAEPKQKNKGDS
jgi:arylsulfatase